MCKVGCGLVQIPPPPPHFLDSQGMHVDTGLASISGGDMGGGRQGGTAPSLLTPIIGIYCVCGLAYKLWSQAFLFSFFLLFCINITPLAPPPLFRSCIHYNCIIPTGGTGNVEGLLSTTTSWNSKENVPSNGTELVGFHEGAGSRVMIKLMWVMSSLIAVAKF